MPNPETLEFYSAYVINVRDFILAESEIRRAINRALKENKSETVKVQTKVYALLYSTFSEANFMKMILTPYGFSQAYVEEILKQGSVTEKWIKCLELAFLMHTKREKGSEVPNKMKELKDMINSFIVDPSLLRNKIAHGQLTIALNRKNTGLNKEATTLLENLDFVTIQRWFKINKQLSSIVEDLIESPDSAHYRFYYPKYLELENYISRSNTWTTETKLTTISMRKGIKYKVKPE